MPAGITGESFPKVSNKTASIWEITTTSSLALATFILAVSRVSFLDEFFAPGPMEAAAAEIRDLTEDISCVFSVATLGMLATLLLSPSVTSERRRDRSSTRQA